MGNGVTNLACTDLQASGNVVESCGGLLVGARNVRIHVEGWLEVSGVRLGLAQDFLSLGPVTVAGSTITRVGGAACAAQAALGRVHITKLFADQGNGDECGKYQIQLVIARKHPAVCLDPAE